MVGLSAMDIALITANIAVSGRFDNYIFLTHYLALGAIAVIFTSFRLNMAWATAAAAAHTAVSVGVSAGLDLDAGDERALAAKVAAMYLIVVGITLIVRFERTRRQAAMARERQAQQERKELSQAIHDTTAQTAYMIGLGLDGAMKLADDSNPQLAERLAAMAALSKSAMWELRRPIDMGRIFEGRDLARVLGSHTATFAKITSVLAEMAQSGEDPQLTAEVRTGLFSIAHNSLANAFLHTQVGRVEVRLDFQADGTRLSVSDDGVGLPEDYAERGRGFSGMEKEAERMGGRLIVETGGSEGGTTIACVVPHDSGAFDVVGQAADGMEAVRTAEESRPDVIVMDVMMPKKDGVEACRDILDLLPDAKVLMLTASMEEDAVIEAIAAGATGFVQKYSGSDELVDTFR